MASKCGLLVLDDIEDTKCSGLDMRRTTVERRNQLTQVAERTRPVGFAGEFLVGHRMCPVYTSGDVEIAMGLSRRRAAPSVPFRSNSGGHGAVTRNSRTFKR